VRTTVTLDPDTEQLIRQRMKDRKISFKQALNDAIRESARQGERPAFETPSRSMGVPLVNLDKALALAGELEDEELLRKMRSGR
jgi:hypothetical protein